MPHGYLVVCPDGGGLHAVADDAVVRDYRRAINVPDSLWRNITAESRCGGFNTTHGLSGQLPPPSSIVVVRVQDSVLWCMRFAVEAPPFLRKCSRAGDIIGSRLLWRVDVETARTLCLLLRESPQFDTSVLANQYRPPGQGDWPRLRDVAVAVGATDRLLQTGEAWFLASLNFRRTAWAARQGAEARRTSRAQGGAYGRIEALPDDLQQLIFDTAARDVLTSPGKEGFRDWKNLRLLCRGSRWAADRAVHDWAVGVGLRSGLASGRLLTVDQCSFLHVAASKSGLAVKQLMQIVLHREVVRSVAMEFAKARAGRGFYAKMPASRRCSRRSTRLSERKSPVRIRFRMRDRGGRVTFSTHAISE